MTVRGTFSRYTEWLDALARPVTLSLRTLFTPREKRERHRNKIASASARSLSILRVRRVLIREESIALPDT
jgi:hypothetical protein